MYFAGKTITEISKETSISRSTIYSWIQKYGKGIKRTTPVNMREYNDLKQKCEQQEMMIEILQNAPCTVSSPLRERYAYIQSISDKYSINLLCKAMNVAIANIFFVI